MTASLRVEAPGGLVEKQDLRRMQNSPRDLKPALHTAGEGEDFGAGTVRQLHHGEHLRNPLPSQLTGHVVKEGVKVQVFPGGQLLVERRILEDESDPAADRAGITENIEAGDGGLPASRPQECTQDA